MQGYKIIATVPGEAADRTGAVIPGTIEEGREIARALMNAATSLDHPYDKVRYIAVASPEN